MQDLDKNELNFEQYNNIESEKERLEEIKKYWGIEENILQGRVRIFSDGSDKFEIDEIKDLDGKYILNPFSRQLLSIKLSKILFKDNLNDLEDKDYIIFSFKAKTLKNEYSFPIYVHKGSIKKIDDIKSLDSETEDVDLSEIIKLIQNNEDMESKGGEMTKVLVNTQAFKKNAKTIYDKAKQEYTVETKKIYEKAQDKKVELELENDELQNQITKKNDKLQQINDKLQKINKEIEYAKIEKEKLIALGILEEKDEPEEVKEKVNIERNEYIDYIIKFLATSYKHRLYYNKSTIQKLYTALSTNQLVILSGSPGTGKTSLVEGFGYAIGAETKIISVQPNWTEIQDLIGFYNPIDKKYISTPFLDFLIEANDNKNKLYIVCLDEMNLAHVEYYFAEFLSKLESNDKELELYSKDAYQKNKEEIKNYMKFIENKYGINNKEDIFNIEDTKIFEEYNKLMGQYHNLLKYNYKISIPENIRFIGTINKDETTKNLSPKVVDRSFIMEVEKYDEEIKNKMLENEDEYKQTCNKVLNLSYEDFKVNRATEDSGLSNTLKEISNIVEKQFNISLNNRFYKQVQEIISVGIIDKENILDNIILTKIIPKISVYIESGDVEKIKQFEQIIKDKPESKAAFEKMKAVWEDTQVLTFWR